mgnify:CR=1 FL=1
MRKVRESTHTFVPTAKLRGFFAQIMTDPFFQLGQLASSGFGVPRELIVHPGDSQGGKVHSVASKHFICFNRDIFACRCRSRPVLLLGG